MDLNHNMGTTHERISAGKAHQETAQVGAGTTHYDAERECASRAHQETARVSSGIAHIDTERESAGAAHQETVQGAMNKDASETPMPLDTHALPRTAEMPDWAATHDVEVRAVDVHGVNVRAKPLTAFASFHNGRDDMAVMGRARG